MTINNKNFFQKFVDLVKLPISLFKKIFVVATICLAISAIYAFAALVKAFKAPDAVNINSSIIAICWVVIILSFLGFLIYLSKRNGIATILTGNKQQAQEPKIISISHSEIAESLPSDKWIIAEIKGSINVSITQPRNDGISKSLRYIKLSGLVGDVEFKLDSPINVLYKYYIPLNDIRLTASYDCQRNIMQIQVPELQFDSQSTSITDLSQIKIYTENYFVDSVQDAQMRHAMMDKIQQEYKIKGVSEVNVSLAMLQARKSLINHMANILWIHNQSIGDETLVQIKWLPTNPYKKDNNMPLLTNSGENISVTK